MSPASLGYGVDFISDAGGGGGGGLITSFSDTFGTNGNLDPSAWMQLCKPKFTPNVSPAWSLKCQIGNTTFDGNPGLIWALCWDGSSAAGTSWRAVAVPIKSGLYTSCFNAKQQFAQVDILTATGQLGQSSGPMVGFNPTDPGGLTCYFVQLQTDSTGNWALRKAQSDTTYTLLASGTGIAAGNTIRLSMDTSVGGQTTLVVKKNGVQLASVVDNTSPLTQGVPGLVSLVVGTTGAQEMRNFSAGTGL